MIAVAGEALVDLVGSDTWAFRAHAGGGPLNTAVALARLAVPVAFVGAVSSDPLGALLRAHIDGSGVDARHLRVVDRPSSLALAMLTPAGEARYVLHLAGTSGFAIDSASLPVFGAEVVALHVASLALVVEPFASAAAALLEREAGRRLVSLDPNIRPAVAGDPVRFRPRFEIWAGYCDVVTMSQDDAAWLYPDDPPERVAQRLLDLGCALGVVTLGAGGVLARSRRAQVTVAAAAVTVVDTIGAGDAACAGLLAGLRRCGALARGALEALDEIDLRAVLAFSVRVASLTCARRGADPPWLAEVLAAGV